MQKSKLYVSSISLLILLIVFITLGIYPFGDKTIVVIDSNTQYVSFISYLKTIFLGNNDFKYLFTSIARSYLFRYNDDEIFDILKLFRLKEFFHL